MRRRQNASSGAPNSSGRRSRQRSSKKTESSDANATGFAKSGRMKTAKAEMDSRRQASEALASREYFGDAPDDPSLIHVSLVIPGNRMLPQALEDPDALNDICVKHKLWITRPQSSVFDLRGRDIRQLQEAVKALNWAIHDMRLSNEASTTRFLAQRLSRHGHDTVVNVELNSRPVVKAISKERPSSLATASDLSQQLSPSLVSSANILRLLTTNLRMRVNFGHLHVRTRKKGLGSNMPYPDFAAMVPQYSNRGGAGLITHFTDADDAKKVLESLMDPIVGLYYPKEHPISARCTVTLDIGDQELVSDSKLPTHEKVRLAIPTLAKPDATPRLNWTVAAPDMTFDWNFQVDSLGPTAAVPDGLLRLMQSIVLIPNRAVTDGGLSLNPPRLLAGLSDSRVDGTTLKSSIIVPFRNTPFAIEVGITQKWAGMKTVSTPDTWWGLEFHCPGWDEGINNVNPGERRKDWGTDLERIWPGTEQSLEDRFTSFLEHIVEIQAALGDIKCGSRLVAHS
ncbi:Alternative oxidase [Purpureocillium lavendulum]|uniref:Alternative oxidase n=1 Tax=Purpureocillium lavendulum TaxID=1247861 RepID=A0AB34G3G0_9HYPO|nr:Alternative oxidase [Purpureocillium lavendulum]